MSLDTVQINNFSLDQGVMADHSSGEVVMLDKSMCSEAAYNYDTLFPSLPENEVKVEGPAPDLGLWNKKMKLKSSVITQVFRVPLEERKFRDMSSQRFGEQGGEQAKICSDIMQKTGAHIEISSSKDQSLTILVTGKEDSVIKARRQIVKELQTQACVQIQIPKEHHRFILGKSGKKLSELEQTTVTKISVPRPEENLDLIKITGTKEGIDRAKHEIQLISDEQAKLSFERLDIPKCFHPFIVGPFNEVVTAIMNETGARINIPPPSVLKDELTIAGEKEPVANAKIRVLQIFKDMQHICQTVSVEVPKNQHRFIIGSRGKTIQEILKETGVSVEIPSPDTQSDTITLRGPQDKLGPALTLVYEKANSIKNEIVRAPSWLHKYIIGKKGANIQYLQETLTSSKNTHVEFSNNEDIIKVEGPPNEIREMCKELEKMTQKLLIQFDFKEIEVDPKFHRHIIGKSGANIKRIKQDSDVQIHIPTDSDNTRLIRIEGSREAVARAERDLREMVDKMENEVTREIHIEQRFHKNLIGARGESIKSWRDQYNQVNITCPEPGMRSDKVILRGPKGDVEECAKHLQQYHNELKKNNFQREVQINKQHHKFIIGKGGVNIKRIRDETNTKIDLPAQGSESDVIIIQGRKEDVLLAENKIFDIQKDLDNFTTIEITIPAKLHNSIIGSKGRLIRSIANDCGGVTIRFPMENSSSDKVTIRGVKEDVQKARKMLMELSSEKQASGFTDEIKARPEHHKFLIGKNGVNIKRVREKTGARIIFPNQTDEDRDTITIIGRKEEVLAAKKELMMTITELDKIVESTIKVDPKYHQHFVTRNADVIKQIGDDHGGVSISFPRNGTDIVTLKGLEKCVEGAKLRILEIVEDLKQMITIECVIPQRHHRTMMGTRGSKVQGLCQQYEVQIKFPEKNRDEEISMNGDYHEGEENGPPKKCDTIVITGKAENCQNAKQALLDLVPITEEVHVPFEHHRFIIGQKGKDVRNMMNTHDVNISIPPQSDESDIIKITGTPSSVESAKAALKEKIELLESEKQDRLRRSYKTTAVVDPQYHPKIIGRGGAVISKIKQDHSVSISFPEKDSENENMISITGYEEDAEAAKQAILKIVQEQEDKYREEVKIDPKVHSRIIGTRGRNVNKIMNDFRVEIRFPRGMGAESDMVMISGNEEDVLDAKDHLLNLEEECLQDINEQEFMRTYTHPPSRYNSSDNDSFIPKEFVVTGAPWDKKKAAPDTSNQEEFPSFGSASGDAPSKPVAWGPSSRR